ncbi:YitT family protein [Thomasclavelia ramosa]|uniref:YitT family protein n=1 Tax=Thomasclavelia ramosa TaxID=1547 RepID=UPI001C2C2AC3|nr:YitT family protein [Thomasclavelia ramosa]MBU9903846.1 YitT family protein [Thomasclavelia ramosa]MBV4084146.1 YitT family protein [Thomasclavelia ramosa]MBV4092398.1 YitT family protein [Thomasclavelia ramosa]MBV4106774.1 YitT family protein [Thomasclavelia ramosa]MBV4110445.1 YitT family protein [Thomasclavelia ramosa]
MKGKLLRIGTIILGNVFVAFAVSTLVLENQLISGGVTGLGIVTNHYIGINISLIVGIINVLLFLLGLFFIGKKFALSTLISTFAFPVLLEFFNTNAIFHNYCQDTLLAVVLAGCLVGIGVGLMIRSDASSGGMDIIAIILNRKLGIPVFIMVNVFDFIILCMQATFSNPTKILYSIVLVFVTSFMLNKTLTKGSKMVQLVVISDCHEMIKKMIIEEADAGVTSLYSQKGFNETDTKTLLTIIPPVKLTKIKEQIKLIDPVAFMVVATVDEVSGRGYTLERHH